MKIIKNLVLSFSLLVLIPLTSFAYDGDISINNDSLRFSTNNILEGQKVRIYTSVTNNSNLDLLGVSKFYANDSQIGTDQAISIFSGKTDDVFIDWTPNGYGTHTIKVKIYPWESDIDNPNNNQITKEIYIIPDTDRDGISNQEDIDDDNDGVNDSEDAFPLNKHEQFDTDGDGIGDNNDTDDDNDDIPDEIDDLPLNPNESIDSDKDGIGNVEDKDDDNDGLTDAEEENLKTNPILSDTDDDGIKDKEDAFPLDPEEWQDTDNDKIGNNSDTDDDNDGILDTEDKYPLNKSPIIKLKDTPSTVFLNKIEIFDASPSFDEDGEIKQFIWEIEGKSYEGTSSKHIFKTKGEKEISLTITDNEGESQTLNFQVNVINIDFYKILIFLLLTILLAIIIYLKYISQAKKNK